MLSRLFETGLLSHYSGYLTVRHEAAETLYQERLAEQLMVPAPDTTFNDTARIDLTRLATPKAGEPSFARIPKGEIVDIALKTGQSVTVRLARHNFCFVAGNSIQLVDDAGRRSPLREGKNIVGRDRTSDIVVDQEYRDVSRKHLIVETSGDTSVRLTDISSLGTSAPPKFLEMTSPQF